MVLCGEQKLPFRKTKNQRNHEGKNNNENYFSENYNSLMF